ncbi:tyrosinase family protein [Photobacterium sp. TY1-4]|uniref:tyrosinase family protein n=1 Tax=Photobacterium sp. TY1-4 TaxID=2899122 RepID=UPI0021C1893B|nr:tyrosinase family protein [Photobacterium sp. TY1-4]UXI04693.1 tyrosinase family protein [Photobacterium sp. TY1-4]
MSPRLRTNVVDQCATNPSDPLYWYEKAVSLMRGRDVSDPTSWGWWAAVHQYYFRSPFWHATYDNGKPWVTGLENEISPSDREFLAKCPHGSFYFLAWHRQYLLAFENAIRAVLSEMPDAPDNWALPYWDYTTSGPTNMVIPESFKNPNTALYFPGRLHNNLDFYEGTVESVSDEPFFEFGGSRDNDGGSLEGTPHNVIHNGVGGAMGSTLTAGLDPLFYLHHANIDRLWAIWTELGGEVLIDNRPPYPGVEYAFKWFHNGSVKDVSLLLDQFSETDNIVIRTPDDQVLETISYTYTSASGLSQFIRDVEASRAPEVSVAALTSNREVMPMAIKKASDIDTLIVGNMNQPMTISDQAKSETLHLLEEKSFRNTLSLAQATNTPTQIRAAKVKLEGVVTDGIPVNYRVTLIEHDPDGRATNQWDLGVVSFFGSTQVNGKTQLFDEAPMSTTVRVPKKHVLAVCQRLLDKRSLTVQLTPDGETTDCGVVTIQKISLEFHSVS